MAGEEPNSVMARENMRRISSEHLTGQDACIEIIDVFQDYRTALEYDILVTPALLASGPGGEVVILGNLRETEKVLAALRSVGIQPRIPQQCH